MVDGVPRLYRPGSRSEIESQFPCAGPLLTRKLNLDLISEHYDVLLRLAGSLKFGHDPGTPSRGPGRTNVVPDPGNECGTSPVVFGIHLWPFRTARYAAFADVIG
ncbi:hypothetical protein AB0J35_61165 [Nonomuraea angiospora]|uniref:hypothetical protein n=1 Tax=Nonomuraea angiospora TaxID=46172 RepID=UPI003443792F